MLNLRRALEIASILRNTTEDPADGETPTVEGDAEVGFNLWVADGILCSVPPDEDLSTGAGWSGTVARAIAEAGGVIVDLVEELRIARSSDKIHRSLEKPEAQAIRPSVVLCSFSFLCEACGGTVAGAVQGPTPDAKASLRDVSCDSCDATYAVELLPDVPVPEVEP